jgi:structural maintenance of chromosome 1
MDAISFVLGIRSSQLRSAQLKDLVYRGRKALQVEGEEGMDIDDVEETQETQASQSTSGADARSAWVMAVYEDEVGKEWKFRRR